MENKTVDKLVSIMRKENDRQWANFKEYYYGADRVQVLLECRSIHFYYGRRMGYSRYINNKIDKQTDVLILPKPPYGLKHAQKHILLANWSKESVLCKYTGANMKCWPVNIWVDGYNRIDKKKLDWLLQILTYQNETKNQFLYLFN